MPFLPFARLPYFLASFVFFFNFLVAICLLFERPGNAATCTDCFIQSRATHYPNSDDKGTETGSCGYGTFGATINGGHVSAASQLYRNGVGCGACYQVRCTNSYYCSDKGVTAVITDHGASDRTDFILSRRTQNYVRKLLDRSYGAVWTTVAPPSRPLSVRMLLSDENGNGKWVVPVNNIPENWKPGDIYDSGVQVMA
ncbi:expansin L [Striga asiatica]|uniref:Expansin L n=1 Tax=Striga asiatica TaxID=4170 RepID=A0A5A7Q441_STRAF|nr:expansin L [Striga asiatica]